MKAIVQEGYGVPEAVLRQAEVDPPALDDDGVLVRARAASVNDLDWRRVMAYYILVHPALLEAENRVPRS